MNRRLDVLRGTTVNAYGDESDIGQPVYTGVPAAIAEVAEHVFDPATQRPQVIRQVKGAVPGWVDLRDTDTLHDPATGWFYLLDDIEDEPGIGYYPPRKLLTLRLRSGVTADGE